MILAVILGPILAVQIQKWLEQSREKQGRRLWVFKVLMSTRGTLLSPDHVQALNLIDVEFYGSRKYKQVLAAWKIYLDHLALDDPPDNAAWDRWHERRNDLLTKLLFEMAKSLSYEFDEVQIRRAFYIPKGHYAIEQDIGVIRKALAQILTGERAIPMDVRSFPDLEQTPEQLAAGQLLLQMVERERRLINPPQE